MNRIDYSLLLSGILTILTAIFFVPSLRGQIAVTAVGLIMVQAGIGHFAYRSLGHKREFVALRDEVEHFLVLVRLLNDAALTLRIHDVPENRQTCEQICASMQTSIERMAALAGKTQEELRFEAAMAPLALSSSATTQSGQKIDI